MHQSSNLSTERSVLSLRNGATVVALAVLIPLALQGVLVAALWNLAQWGSQPERLVEDVTFAAGSTLGIGVAILVILIIRYAVLAGYWLLVLERFESRRRTAFLAALPIAGLWWSLQVSTDIARRHGRPRRLTPEFTTLTVGFTALGLFLLPLSMQVATASEESEVRRLAAPCSNLFPQVIVEDPVISIGSQGLDEATFQALVDEVVAGQEGAVAQTSDEWPLRVAREQTWMLLWEEIARSMRITASVEQMEEQIAVWEETYGGRAGLDQQLLNLGIAPSQLERFACSNELDEAFEEVYPRVETEDGTTEYFNAFREAADRVNVDIDPSIGYWDPSLLTVEADPPSPSEEAAPDESGETQEVVAEAAARNYATRVEYDIESIPTQEFDGSLSWEADICAGATELLQDRFLDRVTLYERISGRWVRVTDAQARAERGGRCNPGQVNLFIGATEEVPPPNWTDKGWRTCRDYQVRIPETPTFQAATVDMCVSTRADAEDEGV